MKTILLQFDSDPLPSSFDRVVAIDAGVDEIFGYGSVTNDNVEPLVHGAMFTRGGPDLKHTAIFVGGSNVSGGEAIFKRVKKTFFGPVRVSVMMDSNGSNTTAAAAVLSAGKHLTLKGAKALVLGGTGPVGQRAAQLLAGQGANVRVASRSRERAEQTCEEIRKVVDGSNVTALATTTKASLEEAVDGVSLVIAAGAAGVQFLTLDDLQKFKELKVAIDVNAVPPVGLAGIEVTDKAKDRKGITCYGALGVGGLKMKIHKAAITQLFESNDQILDTEAIYAIGSELLAK